MSSTPHAAVAADNLIATPAFDRWFSKLRRSALAELPTPRRVGMNLLRAGGAGLLALLLYFQFRDAEGLVFVAAGVVGFVGSALACVRLVLRAIWQTIVLVTRRSRWREPGSGWDGILERILGAGELGGQISLKSIDDLIGSAFEFLLELALKPWAMRRKRKQQARFAELARHVADEGEQVLAAWPASMNRRSLASILLLNFNRRSVLVVVTDARLRCVGCAASASCATPSWTFPCRRCASVSGTSDCLLTTFSGRSCGSPTGSRRRGWRPRGSGARRRRSPSTSSTPPNSLASSPPSSGLATGRWG